MNTKLVVLLGGVGAVHLVAGGLFLAGGCAQEDPPMPPGIYVPKQPVNENPQTVPPETPAYPSTAVDPVAEPTPAPAPAAQPLPAEPMKKEAESPSGGSGHGDKAYIVVKNDSLWLIARKNGLTIEELAAYNHLPANAKLKIGQKLYIPATGKKALKNSKTKAQTKAVKPASKKGRKKAAPKASGAGKTGRNLPADGIYTIKAGDNFSTIAKRHGLKVSDLMEANPGVDSSRLKIGQKIRLTAGAAAVKNVPSGKKAPGKKEAAPAQSKASGSIQQPPAEPSGQKPAAKSNDVDELLKDVDDIKTENKSESAASNEAVKAVAADPNSPTAVLPDNKDRIESSNGETSVVILQDSTLAALCKKYRISEADIKKLNPSLPADGKLKAGSRVLLIGKEDGI